MNFCFSLVGQLSLLNALPFLLVQIMRKIMPHSKDHIHDMNSIFLGLLVGKMQCLHYIGAKCRISMDL
jgi:hypothetical protein